MSRAHVLVFLSIRHDPTPLNCRNFTISYDLYVIKSKKKNIQFHNQTKYEPKRKEFTFLVADPEMFFFFFFFQQSACVCEFSDLR